MVRFTAQCQRPEASLSSVACASCTRLPTHLAFCSLSCNLLWHLTDACLAAGCVPTSGASSASTASTSAVSASVSTLRTLASRRHAPCLLLLHSIAAELGLRSPPTSNDIVIAGSSSLSSLSLRGLRALPHEHSSSRCNPHSPASAACSQHGYRQPSGSKQTCLCS